MYDPTKPYKYQIIESIKSTWKTPNVAVSGSLVSKKFSYSEYHHSDGIGSKGIYHWQKRSFKNAVIDAMAMNLNDLAMVRATPYAVVDHMMLPKDDHKAILKIIKDLSSVCRQYKIAITGGETAIHYDAEGMELSISMLGFVKKSVQNKFRRGDVLIGIASSGLHSNGFSKVRGIFGEEFRSDFIKPTSIYLIEVLKLTEKFDIGGMMHITGGAYTKLKDLLGNSLDTKVFRSHKLQPQKIFHELFNRKISDEEMYKTFNCGVGYILSVRKEQANKCLSAIKIFQPTLSVKLYLVAAKLLSNPNFPIKLWNIKYAV